MSIGKGIAIASMWLATGASTFSSEPNIAFVIGILAFIGTVIITCE